MNAELKFVDPDAKIQFKCLRNPLIYREIFEHLPCLVYRVSIHRGEKQKKIVELVNRKLKDLTGYSEKMVSESAFNLLEKIILPEDKKHYIPIVSQAIQSNSPFSVTYRIRHRDGSIRYLKEEGWVTSEPDGVLFLEGIVRDISEESRTRDSLKANEERFRALVDQSQQGLAVIQGTPPKFKFVNRVLCRFLGYSSEELLMKDRIEFEKLVYSEDLDKFVVGFRDFYRKHKRHFEWELRINRKNRSVRWLQMYAHWIDYCGDRAVQAVFFDITKRKQTELSLKESEEKYRRLVENNQAAIVIHCKGKILYANPKTIDILKIPDPENIIGQSIFQYVSPEFHFLVRKRLVDTEKKKQVTPVMEEKFIRADGKELEVEVTSQPITFNGKPATQVVFWDVTRRKLMENALRESEELSRAVIECSPSGVSIRDADGNLLMANDAWKRIMGLKDGVIPPSLKQTQSGLFFEGMELYLGEWQETIRRIYTDGGSLLIPELYIPATENSADKWISQFFYSLKDSENKVWRVVILTADITSRKNAGIALEKRDRILSAVTKSAESLLKIQNFDEAMEQVLKLLGESTQASRVYVFENSYEDGRNIIASQKFEWVASGIEPQIDNEQLRHLDMKAMGFSRWIKDLQSGKLIYGNVSEFPKTEQALLAEQDIYSIAIVPIFFEEKWWGFIGLDYCFTETTFTFAEIDALRLAASVIGSTLERNKKEMQIRRINEELELRILNRTKDLQAANTALAKSLESLKNAQKRLVESEKMASLGNLVSGIAHEINNPVGISITAASHVVRKIQEMQAAYLDDRLTQSEFEVTMENVMEGAKIVLSNLGRASQLIRSFKQVAVDQSTEEIRDFNFRQYFEEILLSLQPEIKHMQVRVIFQCPDDLVIRSYPGGFYQVFTNLIINSLRHGFEGRKSGKISIQVKRTLKALQIIYRDNGVGIPAQNLEKLYEPFFTTSRKEGGCGLGMNIVYNLITQNYQGTITCNSTMGEGVEFIIELPFHKTNRIGRGA